MSNFLHKFSLFDCYEKIQILKSINNAKKNFYPINFHYLYEMYMNYFLGKPGKNALLSRSNHYFTNQMHRQITKLQANPRDSFHHQQQCRCRCQLRALQGMTLQYYDPLVREYKNWQTPTNTSFPSHFFFKWTLLGYMRKRSSLF